MKTAACEGSLADGKIAYVKPCVLLPWCRVETRCAEMDCTTSPAPPRRSVQVLLLETAVSSRCDREHEFPRHGHDAKPGPSILDLAALQTCVSHWVLRFCEKIFGFRFSVEGRRTAWLVSVFLLAADSVGQPGLRTRAHPDSVRQGENMLTNHAIPVLRTENCENRKPTIRSDQGASVSLGSWDGDGGRAANRPARDCW